MGRKTGRTTNYKERIAQLYYKGLDSVTVAERLGCNRVYVSNVFAQLRKQDGKKAEEQRSKETP